MYTVTHQDPAYTSPIVGNGEIVTLLGPTGYHNGADPADQHHNRKLFWAGRRLNTPTRALVRFGTLKRTLALNEIATTDSDWSQSLDYDHATVISTLDHGALRETTRSLICLTSNVMIFQTRLENTSSAAVQADFSLNYEFETTVSEILQFPYMSHFDFRPGYNAVQSSEPDIKLRIMPREDGMRIAYEINDELGEVRVGWSPQGTFEEASSGGSFRHNATLEPGSHVDYCFWVMLSDRRRFTHWPDFAWVQTLIREHERAWGEFWATSTVELDDDRRLQDMRDHALYAIRCNASPWSIPPTYLATTWEGRTFHDELYPFLGLISGGHARLAERVAHFRLRTLDVALKRSGYHGALFPWETLETGEEGGPYGHWMDERFHVAQFSEVAWRYYLYTRSLDDLRRLYPLLRECAELFVHDVLLRDENGVLKTRIITDFDEHIYPVSNGIFTICAAVRSLECAAEAARLIDADSTRREMWQSLAHELRPAMPTDPSGAFFRSSDKTDHWHIAQVGMIYPFSIDVYSAQARETLTRLGEALRTPINASAGSPEGYHGTHWMWATAMLATGFFMQGRADEGWSFLRTVPNSAGPFLSPNEQLREAEPKGYTAPWFTTSSGAVVYAIHSMLVQVDEFGTTILPALPEALQNVRFSGLMGTYGVQLSGEVIGGRLARLSAESPHEMTWVFRIPDQHAAGLKRVTLDDQIGERGLRVARISLNVGANLLVG